APGRPSTSTSTAPAPTAARWCWRTSVADTGKERAFPVGILDIFGGGKSPERATKLKAKVTQKYGGPEARQKAIQQPGEMDLPEATASLLARFTITVEPATTDTDEKEHVFGLIRSRGEAAVDPVRTFLRRNDHASSWAMRLLRDLLPADRYTTTIVEHLRQLSHASNRDPAKTP